MKKTLLAIGVASLAFAAVAAAATFSNNLTVGSTGADVVALQNALIAGGYNIPAISSGAATPGYFGSQTKSAVMAYQAKNSIPNTGFVGPLTRAALNGGVASAPVSSGCPEGYTCTANPGTTAPIIGAPVGISTPGVAGTLAASLWTTPSGVTAYKGQAYDIAGFKLQAGSSDMAVSSVSVDFNTRLWLYASSITLRDDTGAIVGTVNNLNASNFSELTVGSDYRITIPVSNTVVRATQSKYLTVNVNFLAVTDRTSVAALGIEQFQVRSVDGTGITDTETVSANSTSGTDTAGNATIRNFTYQSTNIAQLVVTTDSSSPATSVIQVSTAAQTLNVPLAIYDVKSQNQPATLQSLTIGLTIGNNINNLAVGSILSNLQIVAGGLTYSASSLSSTSASFTNLQIPLPADQYVPIKVLANLSQDTSNAYDNVYITTTLNTTVGNPSGASAPTNLTAVDSTYNNIVFELGYSHLNAQAFSASGVNATSLDTTPNPIVATPNNNASSTAQFSFVYTLAAGNNPIYVSATSTLAASTTLTGAPGTISVVSFRDNDSTQDSAGQYFYIAPGGSKTFTLTLQSKGAPGAVAGTYSVTKLWYGTGFATGAVTGVSSLSASTIPNTLYANLSY